MGSIYLGRVKVDSYTICELVKIISQELNSPKKSSLFITYLNAYVFCLAYRKRKLKEIINNAFLVVADGISIKQAAIVTKNRKISRCIMTKLFDEFIIYDFIKTYKTILIGTSQSEADEAARQINKISKNIQIIESFHGYYDEKTLKKIFEKHINIDVVLIGMGTPKSEYISQIARSICQNSIIWHIGGGTIKCYAGTKKRAPEWISKLGIEWTHRFIFEKNTRIRYLIYNPLFLSIVLIQSFKALLRLFKAI